MNQLNIWAGLFLVACFSSTSLAEDKRPPNLIIILTDDQGYGDLGCFGGTHVQTPRIDLMASEGARLTNFYVAGPVCTPSRAALMTGCYPKRVGMASRVLLAGDSIGLNPTEITIAEVLQSAGYRTGMIGKWHLGDQSEFMPMRQGFDEFFGLPYSHDICPSHANKKYHFPPLPLMEGEKVIEVAPDPDYLTQRITECSVRFIEENKDIPFFLYIPHPAPHRPISVSPPFRKNLSESLLAKLELEKSTNEPQNTARDEMYAYAVNEIDWSVGQILDALKKQGIDENTMVIYTSDNGPMVGKSGPLKGGKGSTSEGGMRVPTVIRWPKNIPAGSDRDEIMTAMDLLPTLAKLAGAKIPSDRVIDGKDIILTLTDGEKSPHEAFFYHKKNNLAAVRSGKWKLLMKGGKPHTLFDLETDIGEKKNVLTDNPEVASRLHGYIDAFQKELTENMRPAGFVKNPKTLTPVEEK